MINHKQTNADLVQATIDLINSFNAGKERTLILMRNFNEIETPHTSNDGGGVCVEDAGARSNKISKPEIIKEIG